jgi:hypothetical protein
VPEVELDRHDTQHVFPVRLVPQDLAEFGLGRLSGQKRSSVSWSDCELVRA